MAAAFIEELIALLESNNSRCKLQKSVRIGGAAVAIQHVPQTYAALTADELSGIREAQKEAFAADLRLDLAAALLYTLPKLPFAAPPPPIPKIYGASSSPGEDFAPPPQVFYGASAEPYGNFLDPDWQNPSHTQSLQETDQEIWNLLKSPAGGEDGAWSHPSTHGDAPQPSRLLHHHQNEAHAGGAAGFDEHLRLADDPLNQWADTYNYSRQPGNIYSPTDHILGCEQDAAVGENAQGWQQRSVTPPPFYLP